MDAGACFCLLDLILIFALPDQMQSTPSVQRLSSSTDSNTTARPSPSTAVSLLIVRSISLPNRITSPFLDCCANKEEKNAQKAKSAKDTKREWGMGSGEWGVGHNFLFPTPHSLLPTPFLCPLCIQSPNA